MSAGAVVVGLALWAAVVLWPGSAARRAVGPAPGTEREPRSFAGLGDRVRGEGTSIRRLLSRRGAPAAADLVPLLDAFAAALRAGLTPSAALALAGRDVAVPLRDLVVAPVLDAHAAGRPAAPAWQRAARGARLPALHVVARSVGLSESLGAPLAEAMAAAAAQVRAGLERERRLRSATAGAGATAGVLTGLPVLGILAATAIGLGPGRLYGSVPGMVSLGLGIALLLSGRVVVRRMIRRVEAAA